MKSSYAMFILLLAMTVVSSLSPLLYASSEVADSQAIEISQSSVIVIPILHVARVQVNDRPSLLNLSTRAIIYSFIRNNPGTQFRSICRNLNLSNGVTQYHLGRLTKAGLLSAFKDGRYKRFFESKKFTKREMVLISISRHETAKKILTLLLENGYMSHKNLALKLEVSSQAVTWHMSRLEEMGVVQRSGEGRETVYFLEKTSNLILARFTLC